MTTPPRSPLWGVTFSPEAHGMLQLALEWAPFRVRVNSIAPGTFPDAYAMSEEDLAKRNADAGSSVPLGRLGHPREVGLMAVFLASDAARAVHGAAVPVTSLS